MADEEDIEVDSEDTQEVDDTSTLSDEGDRGFPAQTKIADMTDEQKVAYWRYQSRKHEAEAKAAAKEHEEYEALKAKAEADRQKGLSDQERALEEAVTKAKADALAEYEAKSRDGLRGNVKSILEMRLGEDKSQGVEFLDFDKFISGTEIDLDAIDAYSRVIEGDGTGNTVGTGKFPKRDPNQGPRSHTRSGGIQAGREMANKRFNIESKD